MKGIVKGLIWLVAAMAIVFIAGKYLVPGLIASIEGERCQNIYAYTPYWRCCVEKLDYSNSYYEIGHLKYLECPPDATKCEVSVASKECPFLEECKVYIGTNCQIKSGFLGVKYITSENPREVTLWSGSLTLQPRECIYQKSNANQKVAFAYKVYKKNLIECGTAGCTQGRTINTGGCEFYSSEIAWDENGNLVDGQSTVRGILYTVPLGECYTYLTDSGRHVIGDTCEECKSTSDCASRYPLTYTYQGKTYGAVCSAGHLQLYDCVPKGQKVCVKKVTINGQEKCLEWGYKTKCDVVKTISVQCCPNTDSCGPNAVCDPETFTCKETAECTYDWQCGKGVICDYANKVIKEPVCQGGKCTYRTVQNVECCYDSQCPAGYFCSSEYKCLQKPITKEKCPWECCVNEKYYFDKPCPSGEVCCADHTCRQNCDNVIYKCNYNGKCEPEIGENKHNCRDCRGTPWWKLLIGSFIISGIIETVLLLLGIFIKPLKLLIKPIYNPKAALMVWLLLSVIIALFFSGIALMGASMVM